MSKESNIISGFVLGALVGGVSALLLAPYSGKRARKKIKSKTKKMVRDAKVSISDATDDTLLRVNEGIQDLSEKSKGSMSRLREKLTTN